MQLVWRFSQGAHTLWLPLTCLIVFWVHCLCGFTSQPCTHTHLREERHSLKNDLFLNFLLVLTCRFPWRPCTVLPSLLESQWAPCTLSPCWNRRAELGTVGALQFSVHFFSAYLVIHLCIHLFHKYWLITSPWYTLPIPKRSRGGLWDQT